MFTDQFLIFMYKLNADQFMGHQVFLGLIIREVGLHELEEYCINSPFEYPDLLFRMAMLEILRDFLESSTIHGLAYISNAKVLLIEDFRCTSISSRALCHSLTD